MNFARVRLSLWLIAVQFLAPFGGRPYRWAITHTALAFVLASARARGVR